MNEEQNSPPSVDPFDSDEPKPQIKSLPSIDYYNRTYANSLAQDDRRAMKLFLDYESSDKHRRLKAELLQVKNSKVDPSTLNRIVGLKRFHRYSQSYEKWATAMLMMVSRPC